MDVNSFIQKVEAELDGFQSKVQSAYSEHVGAIRDAAQEVVTAQDSPEVQLIEGMLPAPVRTVLNEFASKLSDVIGDLPAGSTLSAPTAQTQGAAARQAASKPADPANPGAPV